MLKTIGIIGGLGPPSTVKYYEWLNDAVQEKFGGSYSPRILLNSLNGNDIKEFRISGDAEAEGTFYAQEAKRLEEAGADFIIIASNTSHKNAPYIEKAISIPLLHLADAVSAHTLKQGIKKVALLGTRPTMERDFYKLRLIEAGLEVIIPDADDRIFMNDTIYNELIKNIVRPEVNERYSDIIKKLEKEGAEAAILGCTELTLLTLSGIGIPLFDTVRIHVDATFELSIENI